MGEAVGKPRKPRRDLCAGIDSHDFDTAKYKARRTDHPAHIAVKFKRSHLQAPFSEPWLGRSRVSLSSPSLSSNCIKSALIAEGTLLPSNATNLKLKRSPHSQNRGINEQPAQKAPECLAKCLDNISQTDWHIKLTTIFYSCIRYLLERTKVWEDSGEKKRLKRKHEREKWNVWRYQSPNDQRHKACSGLPFVWLGSQEAGMRIKQKHLRRTMAKIFLDLILKKNKTYKPTDLTSLINPK